MAKSQTRSDFELVTRAFSRACDNFNQQLFRCLCSTQWTLTVLQVRGLDLFPRPSSLESKFVPQKKRFFAGFWGFHEKFNIFGMEQDLIKMFLQMFLNMLPLPSI